MNDVVAHLGVGGLLNFGGLILVASLESRGDGLHVGMDGIQHGVGLVAGVGLGELLGDLLLARSKTVQIPGGGAVGLAQ